MVQETSNITRVSFNHWTIHTEIEIDAPAPKVWQVLTDFEAMPSWSNTLQKLEGRFEDGVDVVVHMKAMGRLNTINHKIFVNDGDYFGWNDTEMLGAGDNHVYKVEDLGNGRTRFIQSDKQEGGMAWLMAPLLFNFVLKNLYMTFNRELKMAVEKLA